MRPEIRTYDPSDESRIAVSTQGPVTPGEIGYAREKIAAALRVTGRPVLFARIRLDVHGDPAVDKPANVHVTVDVGGRPIQVRASAATMRGAADEAHDRLAERLRRSAGHWQAIRGRQPSGEPNEWRHGQRPAGDGGRASNE